MMLFLVTSITGRGGGMGFGFWDGVRHLVHGVLVWGMEFCFGA